MVISEGASVGTVITSVKALDADSGLNGRVGYALMNFKDTFKMGTVSKHHKSVKTLQMSFFLLVWKVFAKCQSLISDHFTPGIIGIPRFWGY